jgi:hypothetical protein
MRNKSITVRISEELNAELEIISQVCNIKKADLVVSAVTLFRNHGHIYVESLKQEINYWEILEIAFERIKRILEDEEDIKFDWENIRKQKWDNSYSDVTRALCFIDNRIELTQEDQKDSIEQRKLNFEEYLKRKKEKESRANSNVVLTLINLAEELEIRKTKQFYLYGFRKYSVEELSDNDVIINYNDKTGEISWTDKSGFLIECVNRKGNRAYFDERGCGDFLYFDSEGNSIPDDDY